jgi:hypothetical protein
MKTLKSLLTFGTPKAHTSPSLERLKTLEGCDAFAAELTAEKDAISPNATGSQAAIFALLRKIEQVDLARRALEIEDSRQTVAHATEQHKAEAVAAIKAAEANASAAEASAETAAELLQKMEGRCAATGQRLAALTHALEANVTNAEQHLKNAVAAGADESEEAAASAALLAARRALSQADEPAALRVSLEALEAQRLLLATDADAKRRSAQAASADHLGVVAALLLIEYDQQAQRLLDCFARAEAAYLAACGRAAMGMMGVRPPMVEFASADHVVMGSQLTATGQRTHGARFVKSLAVAAVRLEVLDAPTPPVSDEPPHGEHAQPDHFAFEEVAPAQS